MSSATSPASAATTPGAPFASAVPVCTVRPPWPDELPRLADAFPRGNFNRPLHPLILVAPGSPERIVGFAGIIHPIEGRAGLTCALRPRFVNSPEADRLLAAALRLAATLGATELRTADDLPPNSQLAPALARAGFAHSDTREIWEINTVALAARLERIASRLARHSSASTPGAFTAEPLGATNRDGVKTLLAAAGLLTAERRHDLDTMETTRAYDLGLSLAVRHRERVVAVALLKSHGKLVTIETLAVAPEYLRGFQSPLLLVSVACARACLASDLPALFFPANRKNAAAALRLAGRCGGRQAGVAEIFSRPAQAPTVPTPFD